MPATGQSLLVPAILAGLVRSLCASPDTGQEPLELSGIQGGVVVVLDKPFVLESFALGKGLFGGKIQKVSLLGSSEPVQWSMGPEGLTVTPPVKKAGDQAHSFKVETR